MDRLQKWFEALAGVSHEESTRLARAHAIFEDYRKDLSHLEMPACWRRRPTYGRCELR